MGTEPAKPAGQRSSTQSFGAVGGDAAAAGSQRSSTQMFGAVESTDQAGPQAPADTTADDLPPEQPPVSRTMIFGNNPFDETVSPQLATRPVDAAPEALDSEPPAEQPPASRTMIFGNNPFDESVKPPAPEPVRSATEQFGALPDVPAAPALAARKDETLRFDSAESEDVERSQKQPGPVPGPTAARPQTVEVSFGEDEVRPKQSEEAAAPSLPSTSAQRPAHPPSAGFQVTSAQGPARVELPPEKDSAPPSLPFANNSDVADEGRSDVPPGRITFYSDKPKKGGGGLVVGVVAFALLALAGYVAAKEWQKKQRQVPTDYQARLLTAQALLRADDSDSLRRANAEFALLSSTLPRWQEPRTWKAIGVALQLDDVKSEMARLTDDRFRLKQQMNKLEEDKDPADWQTRINVLQEGATAIERKLLPMKDSVRALEQELDGWLAGALPSSEVTTLDEASLLRAQLVAAAARGAELGDLVRRYQMAGPSAGGWDVLAQGIRASRTRLDPGYINELSANLEALRQSDSGFIRAHLVAARLHLLRGDIDKATAALDTAIALNPAHQLARATLESLQRAR